MSVNVGIFQKKEKFNYILSYEKSIMVNVTHRVSERVQALGAVNYVASGGGRYITAAELLADRYGRAPIDSKIDESRPPLYNRQHRFFFKLVALKYSLAAKT